MKAYIENFAEIERNIYLWAILISVKIYFLKQFYFLEFRINFLRYTTQKQIVLAQNDANF